MDLAAKKPRLGFEAIICSRQCSDDISAWEHHGDLGWLRGANGRCSLRFKMFHAVQGLVDEGVLPKSLVNLA